MDWMLFDALYPLAFGWRYTTGSPLSPDGPTEGDLWIAEQAYEFVAARSLCDKCGAELGRKLDLAVLPEGTGLPVPSGQPDQSDQSDQSIQSEPSEPTWLIAVGARCRGWRRHRHSAVVSEWHGGLRFGALRSS
jgi:hypothetical protein